MRHLQSLRFIDAVARAGSIRSAAHDLAITSTALNRRILAFEDDLGVPIFDRLPRGVRLSTAGELLLPVIRAHLADMERLNSQIADLSGVRRGHVSIGATRVAFPDFLPEQINRYREAHPNVTFEVHQRTREEAEAALVDHTDDIALVFEPLRRPEFQTIASIPLAVHAIMRQDHPLSGEGPVRLQDCLQYGYSLPIRRTGVRDLLDLAAAKKLLTLQPQLESEDSQLLIAFAAQSLCLTFDVVTRATYMRLQRSGLAFRPIRHTDMPSGRLYLGQLKGRTPSVAAARFADQVALEMEH